jgi:hypothetical protein
VTRTVILVPRREDNGPRDRLWAVCKARWRAVASGWPIFEGHHTGGPFNRSAAINAAARAAGAWDVAVIIDADVMLDIRQVKAAVSTAARTGRVTWAHREWRELTKDATEEVVSGRIDVAAPDISAQLVDGIRKQNPISWSCCIVVPRAVWDALGGFDERFRGWGGEDTAFAAAVQGLHGHERIEGPVWNLWHPRKPGDGAPTGTAEYLFNMRLRDRYAYALRRDHHEHDRIEIAPPDERLRDMGNYERFETQHGSSRPCHCGVCAAAAGLPDWSDWWPTLGELVSREEPIPTVALVVHTGGAPDTWDARSAYLRGALASMDARLQLPRWERKVIWSDWGEERLPDLEAIAQEHGLYVKGPARRLGYTESMRAMWKYIARYVRAQFVFQVEDDFEYLRDVDVAAMVRTFSHLPELVQMALLREPISEREHAPDTILGHPLSDFSRHDTHLEHRRFFTVNPMLMRTVLASAHPWPSGPHSEAVYGRVLFRDPKARAALWGDGRPWITHIGDVRAGGPY